MLENDTDTPPIKSKPSCLEMNQNEVLLAEGLPSSYFKQSFFFSVLFDKSFSFVVRGQSNMVTAVIVCKDSGDTERPWPDGV